MKKVYLVIIIALFLAPLPTFALLLPMGGMVTAEYTCDTGLLLYVRTSRGVLPFMWFTGNLPFAEHIIPHPGQYLLGMAVYLPVPCFVGVYPIGAGFPILYHGSSF